jgi:group I intron endonuclease
LTKTREEFELFKLVALILYKKEHLTSKGFLKILAIKAAMYNGLTGVLAENFPNTIPMVIERPSLCTYISIRSKEEFEKSLDPHWIVGFTEGKGSFKIEVQDSPSSLPVKLNFQILIHDKELLALILNYFNCGTLKIHEGSKVAYKIFTVTNFEDISNIIITFFQKYPLQGMKKLDLDLFIKVSELIKTKGDLTGVLEEIIGRKFATHTQASTKLDLNLSTIVPSLVYSNADTEKLYIVKNNRGKSGVYCWVNNESGVRYVGSSIDLGARLLSYYSLRNLMRENMVIYKALLKYGHSKFSLEILEYCDQNCVIKREQYYIDFLKPKYNILKIAGSFVGYKHTPEALEKLRLLGIGRKHYEEAKAKIRLANIGSSVSDEIRLKISNTKLKANFKHSEEAKLKIGQSSLARNGWVTYVTNVKTGKTESYLSRHKAAIALNIAPLTLKRYLESKKLYKNTYKITTSPYM